MSKFIVDSSFWNLFPEAKIGVILLKDYQNAPQSPSEVVELLKESNQKAREYLTAEVFSDNKVVIVYRDAYRKFKTKKGARSSVEALLKRSIGDKPVSSINSLVDIYNAASLRFALPVGAENIDTFVGDLKLTMTDGGDEFYLIGDEKNNPTLPGEICYKDDTGAVCRCLNWRDGERTMITEKTTNAFIVIELIDPDREVDMKQALDFMEVQALKHLGGTISKYVLTIDQSSIDL